MLNINWHIPGSFQFYILLFILSQQNILSNKAKLSPGEKQRIAQSVFQDFSNGL